MPVLHSSRFSEIDGHVPVKAQCPTRINLLVE